MAGILANSAARTMSAGETSPAASASGFVIGQEITLTVTPATASLLWGLGRPALSRATSALDSFTGQSVSFTPDRPGAYAVSVIVDSNATYTLEITVSSVIHLVPQTNASVPTPAVGAHLFFSSNLNAPAVKLTNGLVVPLV